MQKLNKKLIQKKRGKVEKTRSYLYIYICGIIAGRIELPFVVKKRGPSIPLRPASRSIRPSLCRASNAGDCVQVATLYLEFHVNLMILGKWACQRTHETGWVFPTPTWKSWYPLLNCVTTPQTSCVSVNAFSQNLQIAAQEPTSGKTPKTQSHRVTRLQFHLAVYLDRTPQPPPLFATNATPHRSRQRGRPPVRSLVPRRFRFPLRMLAWPTGRRVDGYRAKATRQRPGREVTVMKSLSFGTKTNSHWVQHSSRLIG